MHMTKVPDSGNAAPPHVEAGAPGERSELVELVAKKIWDWEQSDQLATELAEHLVELFLGKPTEGLAKEK